jgi:tetratricopeptide (TPR) repeat protein
MRASAIAAAAVLAGAAVAGPAAAVDDYDACIAMIEGDPASAVREASAWIGAGGGAPARHCHALALIATGADSRAIDELLGIAAEEPALSAQARAEVLVQAGEMLLDRGEGATARAVAEQALALAPGDARAAGLGAAARLARGDAAGALGELDAAMARGRETPRLLLLRAAAQRRLGQLVAARDDAEHATELAPEMASAWLERGRVAAALGDRPDARDAFLRAIELDRTGEIGAEARTSLQRMEASVAG